MFGVQLKGASPIAVAQPGNGTHYGYYTFQWRADNANWGLPGQPYRSEYLDCSGGTGSTNPSCYWRT